MDKIGVEEDINKLVLLVEERKLVLFVGSGISLFSPSGLPTGNQLRDSILEALAEVTPELRTQIDAMKKKNPSPELVYQMVYAHIGNFFFKESLDVLKRDRTNSNHLLLAALAQKGYLKTIVTTNFDYLIERALKEENVNFSVYYDEKGFRRYLSKGNKDSVAIIKLHGTIQRKRSVIGTLGETTRGLSPNQTQILDKLLKEQYLLFLGYSGNDIDIYPRILTMADTAKGIYWNFRSKESISEQIQRLLNAYKDRAIPIIKDLGDLLEQVAYELNIPYSKPDLPLRWWQQIWGPGHLHKWATILTGDDLVRSSIIASLFYHLEDFEAAIYSWQEFARLAEKKADDPSLALAYNNIGVAYRHKEQWDEAIEYWHKSLEISEKSKNIRLRAGTYHNLGLAFGRKGQGDKAIEYFRKSLVLSRKLGDIETTARTYNNLGTVHKDKEQWDEAIKYYKKGLEFSERSGDIKTMAKIYANLEVVYGNKGERDKAIECFRKNVELSQRLEDIEYKDVFLGAASYKK